MTSGYRPKRSFGQGNIFTPVCHSVHRGGGGVLLARPPLPGMENPPLGMENPPWRRHTPRDGDPPGADTPPRWRTPPGSRLRHTVYDRPVRILLECILVFECLYSLIVLPNDIFPNAKIVKNASIAVLH